MDNLFPPHFQSSNINLITKLKSSHESPHERLALAVPGCNDAEAVGRPLEVVNAPGQDAELVLKRAVAISPPDPDGAGDVS